MCDGQNNNMWIDRTKYYDHRQNYDGVTYSNTEWHINFQGGDQNAHQINKLTFDMNPRNRPSNAFPQLIWES